jgi:DNA helicase-2/ATP-dependent DNA helicase PcrA
MHEALPFIPEITNEDIEWVRELMRLDVLDEPRRHFLAARNTLDVVAYPGSGKTTLIVAKLAILARNWFHKTKGICVVSHTNVAREEIERGLGGTIVGQRLLRYPHFIDTIHGFVNRFLALPWLNSNGFPSPTIDNEITTAYRRGALTNSDYWTVQSFLKKKGSNFDDVRICARDLSFDLGGKPFPAGPNTDSFKLVKRAVETAAQAGYFCHDEMFVWAGALLQDFPAVASWLRHRFPLVIIDEMQDTFEAQGAVLHTIFPRTSPDIVVQRVGDPNQAIFDDSHAEPNKNDLFPDPDPARCLGIPNSYRFGPEIAALASPFAVMPVGANGLCGIGPKAIAGTAARCPNAIFIFPDNSTAGLLDAYGKHVLTVFNDGALAQGAVTAVGAIHQDASDVAPGHPHFPKSVPHYWNGYSAEVSKKESHPRSFIQYIRTARAAVRDCRDLSPGIEKIAAGLIRLARSIGDAGQIKRKIRSHRAIVDVFTTNTVPLAAYRRLIKRLLIDWISLSEGNWSAMQDDILGIAYALCENTPDQTKATPFMAWAEDDLSLTVGSAASPTDPGPNVCRVADRGRCVDIRLGSIHSVKGQTHLATMVLNTYWHHHSSKRILPWLLGSKCNKCNAGAQDTKRLFQTYVAMTRPTHLICLGVPRFTFGDDQVFSEGVVTLKARGWCVAEIIDGVAQWHA